jgi:type IV pilus assembly protein PilZ
MTEDPKFVRKSERLQHELLVAYRTVGSFITDWAVNISRGGMFINTRNPMAIGTVVKLKISLPDAAFPFDLTGKVIRVQPFSAGGDMSGMGIEFVDIDEEKALRLERFVDVLRRELPDLPQVKK